MADALEEKGKVYALHIYDHDGHSLPQHREDRNRLIIDWFYNASPSANSH
jgi:dipeptidyl aminopeptidase/acylaminoacyl peptidase